MAARTRNPEQTRRVLLEAAFAEIYRCGFQAASLDRILATTGVTKGALYHHFPSKTELGYAVIDEVVGEMIHERWLRPFAEAENAIDGIADRLRDMSEEEIATTCEFGCPLNNLAQEMSPLDEGFRVRIGKLFADWRNAVTAVLERGRRAGLVRADVHPEKTALMIVGGIEGGIGLAKTAGCPELAAQSRDAMLDFLEGLRPGDGTSGRAAEAAIHIANGSSVGPN